MPTRRRAGAAASLILTLAACGDTPATATSDAGTSAAVASACQNITQATGTLTAKLQPCEASASGMPPTGFLGACGQAIAGCSSADVAALNGYASCLESLPACNPSDPGQFESATFGCVTSLLGLSSACESSLLMSFLDVDGGL